MNQCGWTQPNLFKLILKRKLTLQEEKKSTSDYISYRISDFPEPSCFVRRQVYIKFLSFSQHSSPHRFYVLLQVLSFFACFQSLCINFTDFLFSLLSFILLMTCSSHFCTLGCVISKTKASKQTRRVANYLKIVEEILE